VHPEKNIFLNLFQQTVLDGSNGRILVSGFWGMARHINYLGEIIQALALALPAWLASDCRNYQSFLYPLYYIALFIPRAMHDDKICE